MKKFVLKPVKISSKDYTIDYLSELNEQQHKADRIKLDEACRKKILSLVKNFPKVWNDPATTDQQRKRMARLIIEDVTLTRTGKDVDVRIRLKGGATHQMTVPVPLKAQDVMRTKPHIIEEIDKLLDHFTESEIAENLNQRNIRPSVRAEFDARIIANLRRSHNLKSRCDRLKDRKSTRLNSSHIPLSRMPSSA